MRPEVSSENATADAQRGAALPRWIVVVGLGLVVLAGHGGSLFDGLFFDDYWHRTQFEQRGWSFTDLIESATFDLPGELVELWWQEVPLQWRYARPFAMLVQKSEWVVADALLPAAPAVAVHSFALLWHFAGALLAFGIARWALRHDGWALLAAVLFAWQPHSFFAVSWMAARNALVGGVLLLGAVWLYLRAAADERDVVSDDRGAARRVGLRGGWLTAAVVCWLLALASRETGIIFPALVLGIDWVAGGWRTVLRRWWVYLLLGSLALAYLYWRLIVFPTSTPPEIYYTSADGPAYLLWAASKLLQLLFALVFHTPMLLGLATFDGAGWEQVGVHAVMLVLLALVGWWYLATTRSLRGRWLWPAWIVLAFLPVLPVFMMPHFAYLAAAALAIALAAAVRGSRGRWRVVAAGVLLVGSAWSLFVYRHLYRGVVRSEQLVYADIAEHTRKPAPGSQLFFINLPVAGIYAPVALRTVWDEPALTGHVLTFAPHPLMMRQACTLTQLDPHTFEIALDPPGWFAGVSGEMLRAGMRSTTPLRTGERVDGEVFDVWVDEADEHGISRLRFVFEQPLASEDYYFYLSSPLRPAKRLTFPRPEFIAFARGAGRAIAGTNAAMPPRGEAGESSHVRDANEEAAHSPDANGEATPSPDASTAANPAGNPARMPAPRDAWDVAVQLADPVWEALAAAGGPAARWSPELQQRVARWWTAVDGDAVLAETRAFNARHASALAARARFFWIQDFAGGLVESDLLLTGGEGADETRRVAESAAAE